MYGTRFFFALTDCWKCNFANQSSMAQTTNINKPTLTINYIQLINHRDFITGTHMLVTASIEHSVRLFHSLTLSKLYTCVYVHILLYFLKFRLVATVCVFDVYVHLQLIFWQHVLAWQVKEYVQHEENINIFFKTLDISYAWYQIILSYFQELSFR